MKTVAIDNNNKICLKPVKHRYTGPRPFPSTQFIGNLGRVSPQLSPQFEKFGSLWGYANAVTSCIAAQCKFGPQKAIVLCADRRIDYGTYHAAHEKGWKVMLAGAGWMALMSGPTSRCHALLSLYWSYLNNHPPLTEASVWSELQAPLNEYKSRLRTGGFPSGKSIELILTGFIEGSPYMFKVAATDSPDDEIFHCHQGYACIGSGYFLAQYSLMNRLYQSMMDIDEVLYYVYEAKRWSELETGVNKNTTIFIQRAGEKPAEVILNPLQPDGIKHLRRLYRRFGPQPYRADYVPLDKLLVVTPANSPDPQHPKADQ